MNQKKKYYMAGRETLSSKIFELRKKSKLTQVQLGEKVGISGGAISQFEKAVNKPTPDTLSKLSNALGFDLTALAKAKKTLPNTIEALSEELDMLTAQTRSHKHLRTSYDPEFRNNSQVEIRTDLLIFDQREFVEFLSTRLERQEEFKINSYFLVDLLALPVDYSGAVVLEIQGSSMAPRYPDLSRYVIFPVEEDHWQYATGVHAIWLKNNKFFFKRIKSNKEGVLVLSSDYTGEQTTIELADIASLWKAGQAIHLPPEEL